MRETNKPRLVGINHIAIEVSDIDQALDFYGKIFDFKRRPVHQHDAGRRAA